MENNYSYEVINLKMDLIDYIYHLQYEMQVDDITVETPDAVFMVWESSSFKVNGEESSTVEFYELLKSLSNTVTCNGEIFTYINNKYESNNLIEFKRKVYSSIIQF